MWLPTAKLAKRAASVSWKWSMTRMRPRLLPRSTAKTSAAAISRSTKLGPSPNPAVHAALAAAPATAVPAAIGAAAGTAVAQAAEGAGDFRTRINAREPVNLVSLAGSFVASALAVAVYCQLRKPIPRRGYDNDIQEAPERNEAHGQSAHES